MSGGSEQYDAGTLGPWEAAHISSAETYRELYVRSLAAPDEFWAEQARRRLSWDKQWEAVVRSDFEEGLIEWFCRGRLNAAYNCLDRHLSDLRDKTAYYWEAEDPAQSAAMTYGELHDKTNRFAALLRAKGLNRGDRVVIYLSAGLDLPVAMLACARIGAVHCVVYRGFATPALTYRIQNCGAKVIVTEESGFTEVQGEGVKAKVGAAIRSCPTVETVIVLRQTSSPADLGDSRCIWLQDALDDPALPAYVPPESMDAEDPLFILYTSGPTAKPKGLVHTHGGYLLNAAMTTQLVFDLQGHETLWITEDIGWISGHTYGVYGPLLNGVSSVIHQQPAANMGPDTVWSVIEKRNVAKFCTFPSTIRRMARQYPDPADRRDLSSLKMVALMEQTTDHDTWKWTFERVAGRRCPVISVYGQSETGGIVLAPFPGAAALKPGACSQPMFGVKPVILDPSTGEPTIYPNQEGVLCIERPWPGMARTIFGDHDRFIEGAFSRVPGLFFTGDGAKQDEQGDYWVLGRIDDVINADGHRLGIPELETVLLSHQTVTEAAVVGFPHPVKGSGVYAFVHLTDPALGSEDLMAELKDLVADVIGDFAMIDLIQWVDTIPKTPSGKILRVILQKIAAGDVGKLGQFAAMADPGLVESLVKGRVELEANLV